MLAMDYEEHNKRSHEIWTTYQEGNPIRVPVTIYADARNWLAEPLENTRRITMSEYLNDPELMLWCQVRTEEWIRHNILSDDGMGYPKDGWHIRLDFQNFLEPAWFGGSVKDGIEPHVPAFIRDEDKYNFLEREMPDAFSGIGKKVLSYYEWFVEKQKTFTYQDIPIAHIDMPFNMLGTDGPFTTACGIRGVENMLYDMVDDLEYVKSLMSYITKSIIRRIKSVRKLLGLPEKMDDIGFADDSIVLLSPEMYKDIVLPFHQQLYQELGTAGGKRSIHLCGDAQRYFQIIVQQLNISSIDTGFPIQFDKLYTDLPSDVRIYGGPEVSLLRMGTKQRIDDRVKEILKSGVMEKSRKFVLREANALSPGTPIANVNTIYEACEKYGYY